MLASANPVTQALLGTIFTWGMTLCGAALVFFIRGHQRKLLDLSLGFSAGVMIAASFWSLLAPALKYAEESGTYGENGQYAMIPAATGFILGALFVYIIDYFFDSLGINTNNMMLAMTKSKSNSKSKIEDDNACDRRRSNITMHSLSTITVEPLSENLKSFSDCINNQHQFPTSINKRRVNNLQRTNEEVYQDNNDDALKTLEERKSRWKRIILLAVAITIHNIPEGLAVGIGFGAAAISPSNTFESARNLAIGIGIQNFPEGLAVSLPLQASGVSTWKSFFLGQLSGVVEPIFGVIGAAAVTTTEYILPYALSFAAGAMIYVVVDDIIPEAHTSGNGKLASAGCIVGFVIMMALDVILG